MLEYLTFAFRIQHLQWAESCFQNQSRIRFVNMLRLIFRYHLFAIVTVAIQVWYFVKKLEPCQRLWECQSDLWHFYDHVRVFCYLSVLFLWFSLLRLCSANRLGFSASVERTFFFSLKRPEWDTLTWRPLVADLSTIFSSLALNWLSVLSGEMSAWSLFSLLHPCSAGISYKTFGSDFFLREKVSFHQLESAMAPTENGGLACRDQSTPLRLLSTTC